MRILHTSDWHLGRMLENISRFDEQSEFIDWLCKCCDDNNIDLVIIAGDIYDTYNPPSKAEELFFSAIDRLGDGGRRAVIVIAGNHDSPERLCAARPLAIRSSVYILGYPGTNPAMNDCKAHLVASGSGWMELNLPSCNENAIVLTLPYPSESRLEELLSEKADEELLRKAYSEKIGSVLGELAASKFRDNTVNLITGHFLTMGGKPSDSERILQIGGAMAVDPSVFPSKTHYAALGHLHRPQKIKSPNCNIYYSGSPLAYSFSESDISKLVYIVDVSPGFKFDEVKIENVFVSCGKPLKKWIAEKGITQAIEWCEQGRDKNAWIDLEIHTDRIFDITEQRNLRELHPGIINIRPVFKGDDTANEVTVSREGRKIEDLFKEFHISRLGYEPPEELMQAFIEIVNDEEADKSNETDIT